MYNGEDLILSPVNESDNELSIKNRDGIILHLTKISEKISSYSQKIQHENAKVHNEEIVLFQINDNIKQYLTGSAEKTTEPQLFLAFVISQLDAVNRNCRLNYGNSIFSQSFLFFNEISQLMNESKNILSKEIFSAVAPRAHKSSNLPDSTKPYPPYTEYRKENRLFAEQKRLHKMHENNPKYATLQTQLNNIWRYAVGKGKASKTIFVSYAWPIGDIHQEWWTTAFVRNLTLHLNYAGIQVVIDQIDSSCGTPLTGFMQYIRLVNKVFAFTTRTMEHKLNMPGPAGVKYEFNIIKEMNATRGQDDLVININLNHEFHHDQSMKKFPIVSPFHEGYLRCLIRLISMIYELENDPHINNWNQQLSQIQLPANLCNVRALSPFFIERSQLMSSIKKSLQQSDNLIICDGPNGSGKTELVLGTIWQNITQFQNVYWLDASSREALINSYDLLAQTEELWIERGDKENTKEEIAQQVKSFLNNAQENDLIVLDNAVDYKTIADLVPLRARKILINTVNSSSLPRQSQKISLTQFNNDEANELVNKIFGEQHFSQNDIKDLLSSLDLLPKQIVLICGYIQRHKIDIATFKKLFQKHGKSLFMYELLPIRQPTHRLPEQSKMPPEQLNLNDIEKFELLFSTLFSSTSGKYKEIVEYAYGIYHVLRQLLNIPNLESLKPIINILLENHLFLDNIIKNLENETTWYRCVICLHTHLTAIAQHMQDNAEMRPLLQKGINLLKTFSAAVREADKNTNQIAAPHSNESIVQPTKNDPVQERARFDEQKQISSLSEFNFFLCKIWQYALGINNNNYFVSKKVYLLCETIADETSDDVKLFVANLAQHLKLMGMTVYVDKCDCLEDIDHILLMSHAGINKAKQNLFYQNHVISHSNYKGLQCYPSNRFVMPILLNNINYTIDEFKQLAELSFYKNDYLSALKELMTILYGFDHKRFDQYWRQNLIQHKIVTNCWNVPNIHTKIFVGRKDILNQMQQMLSLQREIVITTCNGMGGVGKTQLVLKFIELHAHCFEEIYWFNAHDRQELIHEYVKLGLEKKWIFLEQAMSLDEQAAIVKKRLEELPSNCLVILDAVPNRESVIDLLPVYENYQCKLLITSRYTQWEGNNLVVSVFTISEATEYVIKVLENTIAHNPNSVLNLVTTLGCLALSLALACAYIKQKNISIDEFLRRYAEQRDKLLMIANDKNDEKLVPIVTIWNMTKTAIAKEFPDVIHLLELCCYFYYKNIPSQLIRKLLTQPEIFDVEIEQKAIADAIDKNGLLSFRGLFSVGKLLYFMTSLFVKRTDLVATPEYMQIRSEMASRMRSETPYRKFNIESERKTLEAMRIAEEYSLLIRENNNQTVTLHMVLHDVIRSQISKELKVQRLQRAGLMLNLICPTYNESNSESSSVKLALLPHLYSVHHLAQTPEYRNDFTDLPLGILFDLQIQLVSIEMSLGDIAKAKKLLERIMEIQRSYHNPSSHNTAAILVNFAGVMIELGDYPKAIEYLNDALKLYGPINDNNRIKVAGCLGNLAIATGNLGDIDKEIELIQRSMELVEMEKQCKKIPWLTCEVLNLINLATAYANKTKIHEAHDLLTKAFNILSDNNQLDQPYGAETLMSIGEIANRFGSYDFAIESMLFALKINKSIYGENHVQIAKCLYKLSIVYKNKNDLNNAQHYIQQANAIFGQILCYGKDIELVHKSKQLEISIDLALKDIAESKDVLLPQIGSKRTQEKSTAVDGSSETQFFSKEKRTRRDTQHPAQQQQDIPVRNDAKRSVNEMKLLSEDALPSTNSDTDDNAKKQRTTNSEDINLTQQNNRR